MKNISEKSLIIGLYVMGGFILKKLKDVQDEIEYFEDQKGVIYNRKDYCKKLDEIYGG